MKHSDRPRPILYYHFLIWSHIGTVSEPKVKVFFLVYNVNYPEGHLTTGESIDLVAPVCMEVRWIFIVGEHWRTAEYGVTCKHVLHLHLSHVSLHSNFSAWHILCISATFYISLSYEWVTFSSNINCKVDMATRTFWIRSKLLYVN